MGASKSVMRGGGVPNKPEFFVDDMATSPPAFKAGA